MIKTIFNPKAFAEVLTENLGKVLTSHQILALYSFKVGKLTDNSNFISNFPKSCKIVEYKARSITDNTGNEYDYDSWDYQITDDLNLIQKELKSVERKIKEEGRYAWEKKIDQLKKGKEFPARKGFTSDVSEHLKEEYFEGKCEICGSFNEDLELHHIQPAKTGGKDSLENAACVCQSCHAIIHSNDLTYNLLVRKAYPNRREFFNETVKPIVEELRKTTSKRELEKAIDKMFAERCA
jgi:5-methylcytosine-specific restriction endonuclease McrA